MPAVTVPAAALASACFARSPLLQEQRIAANVDWTPDALLTRRSELIAWALERWAVEGDAPLDPEAEAEDVEDPAEELDV
jgi:hypothetical protein